MLVTPKALSLIEQKRLQWAKEREEMVGFYGLWGRPRNINENKIEFCNRSNQLPPIEGKGELEEQNKAEESETSGYLSDSPKHFNEKSSNCEHQFIEELDQKSNNEVIEKEQCWNEVTNTDQESYWAEKKLYKNFKNENWAHQNSESINRHRLCQSNRNFWHGTPDSLSSDDGARLRWGDRGVGIGHLWEPVVNQPDSRLPMVADPFRQTPKWVEKGLKNSDGNKADILIIHHPGDNQFIPPPRNYLLGQNAPISLEVIEERERKRKKALEHQFAIKKQLEEREMKRKQEKENRIREERLEEERIKKEQEIERLRYEEEQRKMKHKEEIEKKKEEVMREAIEVAEKRAKEEKRLNKKHLIINVNQKKHIENERVLEQPDRNNNSVKTIKYKKIEEKKIEDENKYKKEQNEKKMKDTSSQFEEITLAQNFQLLSMNGLTVDGGLALMLDSPGKDNSFLLSHEGVQLAFLMSPRNAGSKNQIMTDSPFVSSFVSTGERILTPSKYRITERLRIHPTNKSTQTNLNFCSSWNRDNGTNARGKKQCTRYGTNSGSSEGSQKCGSERHHKHIRCFSKYFSKPLSSKLNLENRPKWGINRPSVQYKKQSEKDPIYQRKIKERHRKAENENISIKNLEDLEDAKEKEMNSVVRLLDCQTDEEEKLFPGKEEILLRNGYRMNSNLSSPVFVPIGSGLSEWEKSKKSDLNSERNKCNDLEQFELEVNEDAVESGENTDVPDSVGFLTKAQLETIKQIAILREERDMIDSANLDIKNNTELTNYFSREWLEKASAGLLQFPKRNSFFSRKSGKIK